METNDLFNVNLFQLLTNEPTYTKFFWNECRNHQALKTAVSVTANTSPPPLIETRDGILTRYFNLGIDKGEKSFTKQQIHDQQQGVNDDVALTQANW